MFEIHLFEWALIFFVFGLPIWLVWWVQYCDKAGIAKWSDKTEEEYAREVEECVRRVRKEEEKERIENGQNLA